MIDIDGASVALEVTDFYPSEADAKRSGNGNWLSDRLGAEMRPQVEAKALGSITVYVTLTRSPDRKRPGGAVAVIAQTILDSLPESGRAVIDIEDDSESDGSEPGPGLSLARTALRRLSPPSTARLLRRARGQFVP